jgi:ribose-phosphate pyrophosphokinase
VQGFFTRPVDDLSSLPVLCDAVAQKNLDDLVVVAPDAGYAKKARLWANRLQRPTAIADKRRVDHTESAEVVELTDSVETQPAKLSDKVEVVSVAGLFAEAIRRIAHRESISVLFS